MKKYTINKYETLVSYVTIEAESEAEAMRLADTEFDNILDTDIVNVWYEVSED